MANQKISQMPAITAAELAASDLLAVVDVSDVSQASSGSNKKITALELKNFINESTASVSSFTWNSATASPGAAINTGSVVTNLVHDRMRRCVVNDAGVVQYYLQSTDSTKKEDGTAAVLTGADGQVMVEIPKFWTMFSSSGTFSTWSISPVALPGYQVHPAFIKDNVEVDYRYIGAYDACVYDTSAAAYVDGLNLDNADALYDYANDKLSSVAGKYPVVGVTRAQTRQLASNRGSGWRQLDFTLWSAVQMLYVIEHQSFYSQNILGAGNTNGSYLASSAVQADSPHTIAGASNSLGNASTNAVNGAGVSAKPGTSFMSYRGIENFYGNAWTWLDGVNINVGTAGTFYVTNNTSSFADNTATGHTLVTSSFPTASGYPSNFLALSSYFLPSNATGGSTTTYLTDYLYATTALNRVLVAGGSASSAGHAGVFCFFAVDSSGLRDRVISARLAR